MSGERTVVCHAAEGRHIGANIGHFGRYFQSAP